MLPIGKLYIVATPIGNLEDITFRAVRVLKEVDLILAEDTRETRKLLDRYQIDKPSISFHQHSNPEKINYLLSLLKEGKNLALVSEAGTPGISDPGNWLINLAIKQFENITVIPIPGPCALTAALSISGFKTDRFVFFGFIPQKKKRRKFLEKIASSDETAVFYESPYRIIKTLSELVNFEKIKQREVMVCRELTKKFETIYRGRIEEVIQKIKEDRVKGEFVVVVSS